MTPDAVRAYAVLDFITEHPDLHDQSMFLRVAGRWPNPTAARMIECGTTACFAGWTVADPTVPGRVDLRQPTATPVPFCRCGLAEDHPCHTLPQVPEQAAVAARYEHEEGER